METPQIENGFTRIANEIVERLASYRISGEEWMILLTILRKTYGYQKKEDLISISQFYEATGLAKPSICRAINKLIKKNVINKKAKGEISLYSFNKLYNTWKPFTKKLMINNTANDINKKVNNINKKANVHLLKSDIQKKKETITKETIQKKYSSLKDLTQQDLEEIAIKYKVPISFVQSKLDDMTNWMSAKGKTYKNYKAALSNWVKTDALKILDKERQTINKFRVTKV
jgi:phage replication O-like protein O